MPRFIGYLKQLKSGGQPIREDGPETHFSKKGTPTMGGLLMLIAIFITVFLWGNLTNQFLLITCFVTLSYGLLGFIDDYKKVKKQNTNGVTGKQKLLIQFLVSFICYFWIINIIPIEVASHLVFPIFKNLSFDLGWFYIIFIALVTVGTSNAVNLTDGLDGLAIVPIMITALCFGIIAYVVGHSVFANYLQLTHIKGTSELAVFIASMIGAGLGFLWYNSQPAQIFMGDTGSLSLGGALGIIAVLTKHEIVLSIIGGLFVLEACSVMLQVYYFKITKGKRIFLMAPLHHHFEKKGWPESKVVTRFWIISIIFALLGLGTLKIR
nr:phospho-N-acetylmuramoyl-pentapeptide-transferase [Rickettsiales endosymbiont of Stachyamoeba lipophora]